MSGGVIFVIVIIYLAIMAGIIQYCVDEDVSFSEGLSMCLLWPFWGTLFFVKHLVIGSVLVAAKLGD